MRGARRRAPAPGLRARRPRSRGRRAPCRRAARRRRSAVEVAELGDDRALDLLESPSSAGCHESIIGGARAREADDQPERRSRLEQCERRPTAAANAAGRARAELVEERQEQQGEERHPDDADPVVGVGKAARVPPRFPVERRAGGGAPASHTPPAIASAPASEPDGCGGRRVRERDERRGHGDQARPRRQGERAGEVGRRDAPQRAPLRGRGQARPRPARMSARVSGRARARAATAATTAAAAPNARRRGARRWPSGNETSAAAAIAIAAHRPARARSSPSTRDAHREREGDAEGGPQTRYPFGEDRGKQCDERARADRECAVGPGDGKRPPRAPARGANRERGRDAPERKTVRTAMLGATPAW